MTSLNQLRGAKAHYDVLWAQVSDATQEQLIVMNQHSDFFRASQDAHFIVSFVYLAHLYDKRIDSSSIPNYLKSIKESIPADKFINTENQYNNLAQKAKPLLDVRHKTVAHIDVNRTEEEIFSGLNLTRREVRRVIYDSAYVVEELAKLSNQDNVGIPRDGRLVEATLIILTALRT